jgi:hypothetical protein
MALAFAFLSINAPCPRQNRPRASVIWQWQTTGLGPVPHVTAKTEGETELFPASRGSAFEYLVAMIKANPRLKKEPQAKYAIWLGVGEYAAST